MQIFLQTASPGKLPELGLIEFQGDFECREGKDAIHGEYLGDLNFTKDNVPFFVIGHHVLYGQEVKLHRPLIMLTRSNDAPECLVTAVVRRKIIFKSRPKPIISENELPAVTC